MHGKDDHFILPHHSKELFANYAGDKQYRLIEGDHNSSRPGFELDAAAIFLFNRLQVNLLVKPIHPSQYSALL